MGNKELIKISGRTCPLCKHRHMRRGYDIKWHCYCIVENFCDKDRSLMYVNHSNGNDKHFTEDCDYFEFGKGTLE